MAKKSKWATAVFVASKFRRVGDCILNLKTIVLNIGNAIGIFATPNPPLLTVTSDIKALELAETLAQTRVVGSAAARDLKYDACYKDLQILTNYVQDTANVAPDVATAISIIEASGLSVKVNGVKVKAPITAKNSTNAGAILLTAKSGGKNTVYVWQISSDGIAWTDLPLSQIAKTEVSDLTAGQKNYFRVRTINKAGTSDWSAAIAIFVV